MFRSSNSDEDYEMTPFEPIFGHCECGAVRFRVDAPALELYHCHCSRCRRLYGALFATYACIRREHVTIEHGAETLTIYKSPLARWRFCCRCGCHLFAEHDHKSEIMWYMPATLEGEATPGHPNDSEKHIFAKSKSPIETITDNLPQYDEYAPPEVSATSSASMRSER